MIMEATKKEIRNQSAWLNRQGGGIIVLLKNQEKRINTLEKKIKPMGQKRDSWNTVCDAPNCGKKRTFECGENIYGKIGGWCSDKHFKKFANH